MILMLLTIGLSSISAQAQAEIKFDKVTHDFGTFSLSNPVQKTTFTFTNVGKAPLVINQVVPTCGCTITNYDKKPVAPGQKGSIEVTFSAKSMFPGHFKKSITVRSNGKIEATRLYIEGVITD